MEEFFIWIATNDALNLITGILVLPLFLIGVIGNEAETLSCEGERYFHLGSITCLALSGKIGLMFWAVSCICVGGVLAIPIIADTLLGIDCNPNHKPPIWVRLYTLGCFVLLGYTVHIQLKYPDLTIQL